MDLFPKCPFRAVQRAQLPRAPKAERIAWTLGPQLSRVETDRARRRKRSVVSFFFVNSLFIVSLLVRRPRQADLSKHISLEWKSLTDEEKAPYVRMSEEAKVVHARIYPGYKYQPRRKLEGGLGAKKTADSGKKKTAKGKKGVKARKGEKEKAVRCEAEVEDQPSGQLDGQAGAGEELGSTGLALPNLEVDFGAHGPEVPASTGDYATDWTWLPEQTLLPITWDAEPDQEGESKTTPASNNVMHPLDENVEGGNENENGFGVGVFLARRFLVCRLIFLETFLPLVSPPGGCGRKLWRRRAVLPLSGRGGVGTGPVRGPELRLSRVRVRAPGGKHGSRHGRPAGQQQRRGELPARLWTRCAQFELVHAIMS